MIEIQSKP